MSPITFAGKTIAGTRAPSGTAKPKQAALDPEAPDRVMLFMRLLAMNLEARAMLSNAIEALREIDTDALNAPALQDHPRRPAMLAELEACEVDLDLACRKVIETNISLARQWDQIDATTKNRFGLTYLIGEPDPDMPILQSLWADDRGLSLLVPFPSDWTVPYDLGPRVFDDTVEVRSYSREEIFRAPSAPF